MNSLIDSIEKWAEDRNLVEGTTAEKQFIKLAEEFGELANALLKNKQEEVEDALGDMFVVMTIIAYQFNYVTNFISLIIERFNHINFYLCELCHWISLTIYIWSNV